MSEDKTQSIKKSPAMLIGGIVVTFIIVGGIAWALLRNDQPLKSDKIGVVVTIPPVAEFAEKVGGDLVDVTTMVQAGADPHTYEPTPRQLVDVSNAEMYAKLGTPIEFEITWLDDILSSNKNLEVLDLSDGVTLIEGGSEESDHEHADEDHDEAAEHHEDEHEHSTGTDPHIWLSPANVKIMVENIYEGLAELDPDNKSTYRANADAYIAELDLLDEDIENTLSSLANRKFMVFHPAWAYFARDYKLEQIAIEDEGKEPSPQGIASLIGQAKSENLTIIFAAPEYSTKSAEVIANEINGSVVLISPLEKGYIDNMKRLAKEFNE